MNILSLCVAIIGLVVLAHGVTVVEPARQTAVKAATALPVAVQSVTDWTKTLPAFYAYRQTPYLKQGTIIPYDGTVLNTWNAFNATTGVYKAPLKGVYFFNFSALKQFGMPFLTVRMFHNKNVVTAKHVRQHNSGTTGPGDNWLPLDVQATLVLQAGDTVHIFLQNGGIYDSEKEEFYRTTSFTGFLIQPL